MGILPLANARGGVSTGGPPSPSLPPSLYLYPPLASPFPYLPTVNSASVHDSCSRLGVIVGLSKLPLTILEQATVL